MNDIILSIISASLLILLLIASIAISFVIASRQKLQQQQELAETKLAFEREIRKVETEVTEEIMSQFSQELHDNIGQLLTAMHIQIENQKLEHPSLSAGFQPIEIYLTEVTQQLRLLSRTLNHDFVGQAGLVSAMEMEIKRMQSLKRFEVHWNHISGHSGLQKDQELMVFRIFQEITQNVLKHSKAGQFYVTLDSREDSFCLTVRDNGKGFDKEDVFIKGKASGLKNIMKRANMAGLDLEISSKPGEGTLIILKKTSY